jgi:hypothetical protein
MRMACWIPKTTNTLRICGKYLFFTATVVAGTRLNVHCLCCFTYSHPQVNLTSIYKVNLCTERLDLSLLQICDMYKPKNKVLGSVLKLNRSYIEQF